MEIDDGSPDPSLTMASIIRSGSLPRPQLGIIGEIEKAIKTLSRTPHLKERICEYIQTEVSLYLLPGSCQSTPPHHPFVSP